MQPSARGWKLQHVLHWFGEVPDASSCKRITLYADSSFPKQRSSLALSGQFIDGCGKHNLFISFPKQVYLWGSILEKNRLDTLVGALGLVGRGFGPAGRAGLGWAWGLAVLGFGHAGRPGWVGRGVGRAGRAVGVGFGRAGAGCWACWACWLGWAWCWAWGLAVLGALGWGGRGVWRWWAR